MNKSVYTLALLILISIKTTAQTLTDVALSKSITWYGVDISEARFLNFKASLTGDVIRNEWVKEISLNPLEEDVRDKIHRKYGYTKIFDVDLSSSERRNNSTDFTKRIVTESYDLDINIIRGILADYSIKGEGYGVLLVVEGFEFKSEMAYIWAVFINKPDKKIIAAKRFICETNRDWRGAVIKVINLSGKHMYAYR